MENLSTKVLPVFFCLILFGCSYNKNDPEPISKPGRAREAWESRDFSMYVEGGDGTANNPFILSELQVIYSGSGFNYTVSPQVLFYSGGYFNNTFFPEGYYRRRITTGGSAVGMEAYFNVLSGPGEEPLAFFQDPCQFKEDIWRRSTSKIPSEYFGAIITDGTYSTLSRVGVSRGKVEGLIEHNGTKQVYFYYPAKNKKTPPCQHLKISLRSIEYYAIPLKATVHTHTPCLKDGTDGVSHEVGDEDLRFATLYPNMQHWVIGCDDVVAQFNSSNPEFFNKTTCSSMK
ncbi:hypothetical protein [Larkinella soli]|uniref:hypothetical protein n=1 Tax=Larkinella soli TaxID=1770527 RepID=UPI000FFBBF3E|nr:hypothetical protein [Larkinella soli]